jgi:uncharacterized membrane protein YciS (DUF1049 family)
MDVNELQATISTLKTVIGVLGVILACMLIYIVILRSQLDVLKRDNADLIKRLEIISRGKVID